MPNHKSCEKRLRQDKKKAIGNHKIRQEIKTLQKRMRSDANLEEKETVLTDIFSRLDKAAKRHIIHKKTASRKKSRMSKLLNKNKVAATE